MCAAYNHLGELDCAIAAGKQALEIDPSFDLARNNLSLVMSSVNESERSNLLNSIVTCSDNTSGQASDGNSPIVPVPMGIGAPAKSAGMTLDPCFPNPTSNTSLINFSLSERSAVKLTLYDVMGREVQSLYDGMADPGAYSVTLNSASLPSGAYQYLLRTPSASLMRSVIISK